MKGGILQKLEKGRIRRKKIKNKGRTLQKFKKAEYCKDSRNAGYLRFKKGRILFNNYKVQRIIKMLCHVDNIILTVVERKPVKLSHINSLGQKAELIRKSKLFSKPVRHLEQQQQQQKHMKKSRSVPIGRREGTRERENTAHNSKLSSKTTRWKWGGGGGGGGRQVLKKSNR